MSKPGFPLPWLVAVLLSAPAFSIAEQLDVMPPKTVQECIDTSVRDADPSLTIGEIRANCEPVQTPPEGEAPRVTEREEMEKRSEWNPYVITPHKQNYILPITYLDEPNNEVYSIEDDADVMKNEEAKLQISLKVPLVEPGLFLPDDSLHFGFTLQSYWQVYNHDISAPFRETNYQPEFFYTVPFKVHASGSQTLLQFGIEHQSNGRSQLLSRSWNRIYTQIFYAKDDYLISFRPWYRIPEDPKDDPLDPNGDDNPDIDDYMGYFELTGAWKWKQLEVSVMGRNNLRSENYGALELGLSFPLSGRLRGYAQYFNGYGESLIDYNYRNERIGVGVLLTGVL